MMIQAVDLYSLRKKLGLSQEKMAEELGVSRNTISRWERGSFNPTAENLMALERLFARLEEPAPEEPPAPPKEEPVPPAPPPDIPVKTRRWAMVMMCVGVICALLIGIAALIGIYSIKQQLGPADTAIQEEELDVEEVDQFLIIESGTRQPLQP